jgi:hypothetical protein
MAGLGRFLAGGVVTPAGGVRTRIIDREIQHGGLDVLLDMLLLHIGNAVSRLVTVEIVYNGGNVHTETTSVTSSARHLSLPFYRVGGPGRLELYVTDASGGSVIAGNLMGRYVHARPLSLWP